jgi:hypothetical protein
VTKREQLALAIRIACNEMGYDIVLRQLAPRTDIGKRNFIERSNLIANIIATKTSVLK